MKPEYLTKYGSNVYHYTDRYGYGWVRSKCGVIFEDYELTDRKPSFKRVCKKCERMRKE